MPEGRNFERVDLPVEIEYAVPGKDWLKGEAKVKNISLGGMQFQVKEKLELGCRVTLRIRLPRRPRTTTATGELVWLKDHPRGKGFDVGVRFTQADPFDLEELLQSFSP